MVITSKTASFVNEEAEYSSYISTTEEEKVLTAITSVGRQYKVTLKLDEIAEPHGVVEVAVDGATAIDGLDRRDHQQLYKILDQYLVQHQ